MAAESARLLENEAAERLEDLHLDREDLRRLADAYVAQRGEGDADVTAFVAWVRRQKG